MASTRLGGLVTLCLALALGPGCAEVISRSTVQITPRTDTTALVLGPPGGEITARGLEAEWTQDGDRLTLRLAESRTCESVRHVPVTRIERVARKTAGGAMWFEYGLGAAALATGLAGLIKPESFSQASVTVDGQEVQDKSTGYRIGGIFTGVGVLLLTAAVVDTVRTRDEVIYTDAYRRERGGTIECRDPLVPLEAHTVELLVDEWSTVEPTDDHGAVRFLLPSPEQLPSHARERIEATAEWDAAKAELDAAVAAAEEARAAAEAEEAVRRKQRRRGKKAKAAEPVEAQSTPRPGPELGPRPEPLVMRGVLRIDRARALAIDFVVPYEAEGARGHTGSGAVEPVPAVDPPPRPRGRKARRGAGGSPDSKSTALPAEGDDAASDTGDDTASDTGDAASEVRAGSGSESSSGAEKSASGSDDGVSTAVPRSGEGTSESSVSAPAPES